MSKTDGSGQINLRELTLALHKLPKAKRASSRGISLKAGLDRDFAAEAHGSRLLYIVEQYEETRKAKEEVLAVEASSRKDKALAAAGVAEKREKARLDEIAALEETWNAERERLLAKIQVGEEVVAKRIEKEKEVWQKQRESADAVAAKQAKAERDDAAEVRDRLKAKQREVRVVSRTRR